MAVITVVASKLEAVGATRGLDWKSGSIRHTNSSSLMTIGAGRRLHLPCVCLLSHHDGYGAEVAAPFSCGYLWMKSLFYRVNRADGGLGAYAGPATAVSNHSNWRHAANGNGLDSSL